MSTNVWGEALTMRTLVCEGRCNGSMVREFDAAVRAAGRVDVAPDTRMTRTTSLVSPHWLQMARGFVYTPHTEIRGRAEARCSMCGDVRRWM